MGFTAFEIKLDNTFQSYFAGQIVSGKIVIGLNRSKKVKGVKLKLIGKAKTHWKENRGKSSTTISETEYYIDEKVYIFGYDDSNAEIFLPQGWNEYPFWFQLPQNIPSSFEMKHGYVKYYLEVIISRESTFKFDNKLTKLFTVNALLDLNTLPPNNQDSSSTSAIGTGAGTGNSGSSAAALVSTAGVNIWNARHEIESSNEKYLCCFCCVSGPISFNLKLPKTGYVPGENISYTVELNNSSQRNINVVTLSLVQYSTFYAKKKYKQVTNVVTTINGPALPPGQTEVIWQDSSTLLTIPAVPPTNLGGGCNIITVEYFVKVEIDIPGGLSLKGKVPVIIGTIPLRPLSTTTYNESATTVPAILGNFPTYNPAPSNSTTTQLHLAIHSEAADTDILNQSVLANLPPPTYEEAIFCYSAQQRREDGLDEEDDGHQGEEDDESRPPTYKNVTGEDGNSDEDEKPGEIAGISSGANKDDGTGQQQATAVTPSGNIDQQTSQGNHSNNANSSHFVPKYVTYKHLGRSS